MRQGSFMVKIGAAVAVGAVSWVSLPIAQAADITIPPDTIGLQTVPGRLDAAGSLGSNTVTVAFNLTTCVDKLLPVSYKAVPQPPAVAGQSGRLLIYVLGLNAKGNAAAVLCKPGPYVAQARLSVPRSPNGTAYDFNEIEIVNLTQSSAAGRR